MTEIPAAAFAKLDPSPDHAFYAVPRFVTHIDDRALAAVTDLYRDRLPEHGTILDLMSSWVSHLPEDRTYAAVIGQGMNAEELAANPRLTRWFVQDFNTDPRLALADGSVDGATICASVQYLQRPVEVLRDVNRVLRPGAPLIITFSNRCFPTKAVAIWGRLGGADRVRLVQLYLEEAGFADIEGLDAIAEGRGSDPLHAVMARSADV